MEHEQKKVENPGLDLKQLPFAAKKCNEWKHCYCKCSDLLLCMHYHLGSLAIVVVTWVVRNN